MPKNFDSPSWREQDSTLCRDLSKISMFNPLSAGDFISLDGCPGAECWIVKQGGYGWQLRAQSDNRVHPTIKDIFGMADFIGAILEHSKNH